MTEILTSALTETAETSTTELQIPNVKESVENASSLLTSITDKFISPTLTDNNDKETQHTILTARHNRGRG